MPGPDAPIKGRGAVSNADSRFLTLQKSPTDDGWYTEEVPTRLATQVLPDRTVRLITTNRSPDIGFSQSINPYKGCEHGCIYCFARPTHAYLDLSPGLDFESRLFYKTGVQERLQAELGHAGYVCQPIAIGTNTDPYQPLEREKKIMRQILALLLEYQHPVTIVTKGALILRDLDLLEALAAKQLVQVYLSVTTLDNALKTRLEPRTASPAARLRTISALAEAGVPAGAMIAPVIPFLNDHELEAMVQRCAEAGARTLQYILIRLPHEVAPLFEQWLTHHYPLKARRVMQAIRSTRGGKVYSAQWYQRMTGSGPVAQLIAQRFRLALKKQGLADAAMPRLRTDLFVPPLQPGNAQLSLF
ncbi:MAG: PA0069 family radical SAM protein [bacterium]